MTTETTICGCEIQHDNSGVGHNWRTTDASDLPANIAEEIAAEIVDGKRDYLSDDGAVHEVHTLPQGMALIPTSIFRDMPQPWFVTTGALTQDSFFSQLAREAGYKLLVDTSVRIKHVCRQTGRVYE